MTVRECWLHHFQSKLQWLCNGFFCSYCTFFLVSALLLDYSLCLDSWKRYMTPTFDAALLCIVHRDRVTNIKRKLFQNLNPLHHDDTMMVDVDATALFLVDVDQTALFQPVDGRRSSTSILQPFSSRPK